ncbi:hypothetical protein S7335_447 [Synechococcus sp. PCC 7335]|nr:hypothetical protein S7335_96 [Synechococcus sp. PCC 7335]EDX83267.1 hypothetical protein S7335_447 [Synechococcus sp. PCC 7335]
MSDMGSQISTYHHECDRTFLYLFKRSGIMLAVSHSLL